MKELYILLIHILIVPALSEIWVIKNGSNQTRDVFEDVLSNFGPSLPFEGFEGYVVVADPLDGCKPLKPPPKNFQGNFIALIKRLNCSFIDKVLNAQNVGYQAVIVRNVGSDSIETMSADHNRSLVSIPSVFVGERSGFLIEYKFQYKDRYHVIMVDNSPFNIQNYLLPFAITIGVCFILMLVMMLVKCIRDYRRSCRHRLSWRALRKLPIHRWRKGDSYECCAVCLEDFVHDDKLRVLPCTHAYHSKCIDPWLTRSRRVCPVCKRKVVTGDERQSELDDSASDDEERALIRPTTPAAQTTDGGTFAQQAENPFQTAERDAQLRQQEPETRVPPRRRRRRGVMPQRRRGAGPYARLDTSSEDTSSTDEEITRNGIEPSLVVSVEVSDPPAEHVSSEYSEEENPPSEHSHHDSANYSSTDEVEATESANGSPTHEVEPPKSSHHIEV